MNATISNTERAAEFVSRCHPAADALESLAVMCPWCDSRCEVCGELYEMARRVQALDCAAQRFAGEGE